jgi:tRNA (cytosine49-C5)-methyltransferase
MTNLQSLPEEFIKRIQEIIPSEKQKAVLSSFSNSKPISIRINKLKTDKNTITGMFTSLGIKTNNIAWYDDALLVTSASKQQLTQLSIYKNGYFYIQNLSSMLPVLILDPKPEEKILDIAAAPGSKTSQIAEMMNNTGEIVANDISRQRLFKLKAIINQQGITNVKILQIPGEYMWKKYPNYFDKVLVDAPCTMEGRFQTQYENSFKDWSLKKIKILSLLQKKILRSAFYASKPGGTIVYATCTLSPEENEKVIDWLLTEEKGHIRIESINKKFKGDKPIMEWHNNTFHESLEKSLRVLPSDTMEGFFVTKLYRLS